MPIDGMRRLALLGLVLAGTAARADERVPGRVLVRYRANATAPLAHTLHAGWRTLRRVGVAHLIAVDDTDRAIATLAARSDVEYAEPDYRRHRYQVTPNDQLYPYQWALPMIRAPQAWTRATGSAAVTVAVIDTGIVPHPELVDRLVPGYDFISDPVNANDGDGRDPDPSDAGDASDSSSALHGSHVAGIIGASTNNGTGVAGVDWSCRIEPVRALGVDRGTGVDSDIADAIRWAAGLHVDGVPDNAQPAAVINMSFGGSGLSKTMQSAVDDAVAAGAVVIAAAGNDDGDPSNDSPAGLRNVITVGAVDETGQRASYSNVGQPVALMAPGGALVDDLQGNSEAILSTLELPASGFTYVYYAGTSQAAPFVSGTISLMKSLEPSLTPVQAKMLVMASADPGSRCADPKHAGSPGCGAGLLDADAALALALAQASCDPRCGDGLVCRTGQCVSLAAIVPSEAGVTAGTVASTGCSFAPSSSTPAMGLLLVAVTGIIWRRRRV